MNAYDGLPSELRIGPALIRIVLQQNVSNGTAWGEWDGHQHSINLGIDQPSMGHACEILWHELLHAIFALARLRSKDDEERVVGTMAAWQIKVLMDNPTLVAWIANAVKS